MSGAESVARLLSCPVAQLSSCYAGDMDYEISVEDYARLRGEAKPPVLLDVREQWEFETAHIEGALLMPMGEVTSRAHNELDPDEHIVVLCHHGQRSLSVTAWLRQQGFEQAQSLAGGIEQWSRAVDGTVPRY